MHYRVRKDRGSLSPSGKYYAPGAAIKVGDFGQEHVDHLVEAGYLESYAVAPPAPPAPPKREGRPVRTIPSIWVTDPAGIRGMGVDELNIMILERDDSVEPFETAEEAIAWLSQDYEHLTLEV